MNSEKVANLVLTWRRELNPGAPGETKGKREKFSRNGLRPASGTTPYREDAKSQRGERRSESLRTIVREDFGNPGKLGKAERGEVDSVYLFVSQCSSVAPILSCGPTVLRRPELYGCGGKLGDGPADRNLIPVTYVVGALSSIGPVGKEVEFLGVFSSRMAVLVWITPWIFG